MTSTRYFVLRTVVLLILPLFSAAAFGQNKQYTENKPDQALKSDARIDPSTLGMSLELPLGGAPGRAGASVSSAVRYSSKQWRIDYTLGFQGQINT